MFEEEKVVYVLEFMQNGNSYNFDFGGVNYYKIPYFDDVMLTAANAAYEVVRSSGVQNVKLYKKAFGVQKIELR